MPSLLMFPFIQCHHTRGRAPLGGFSKPLFSESEFVCGTAAPAPSNSMAPVRSSFVVRLFLMPFLWIVICPSLPSKQLIAELIDGRVDWRENPAAKPSCLTHVLLRLP
jgi:hypothetical protein